MNFFDGLMAPLGKNYCALFYFFGLFSLLLALIALGGIVVGIFNKKAGFVLFMMFINMLSNIFMYYVMRIYYSMCIASLR
jgi:hypothetical protein